MAAPLASRAATVSVAVSPIAEVGLPAVSAIVASRCATVMSSVAVAAPLVAVIVAVPLPTAVMVAVDPDVVTVATDALLDANVTMASGIATCDADLTAAATVRVSPIDTSDPVADGASEMSAATGAVTLSLLQAARTPATTRIAKLRVVRIIGGILVRGWGRSEGFGGGTCVQAGRLNRVNHLLKLYQFGQGTPI